ncbi:protein translocase subunit secA [Jatrophihabitans endophyticus]|uniref:Protein translocase subunit SecA n=1 Tax=Jatrophihabitans endophyticus TaxID=1206085 RepID=A0A1M5EYF3_9ACTN|nr:preprotein translocase subunit SecA [Jatrophihabitans endophyticus]SHF84011.1 protein translocase subunit secA [Jatrophihabitans endophyticus]
MVLSRILRAGEGKQVRRLSSIADHIETLEEDYVDLSDAELRALTDTFKERLADDETLDDLLPEAFAVVREAARRTLGQFHYKVQLMGGAALHLGNIAEMKTGEGKTLVSTLPSYLNALSGLGVHQVTTNDYLATRDADWMGRVHRFLGLTVGKITNDMPSDQRRAAYLADITYGTNNEFGFDYLRDNMAWSLEDLVQRGHNFAIVDEADSILIDEARTPLIISGPAEENQRWYLEFARIAPRMKKDEHYEVEEGKRTVAVTEDGVAFVEDQLGIDNLYEAANTPLVGYLNNSLKAKELFKRDRDYIVNDGEVMIVDEFTGRVLQGRRYNEGMHQAIEAKEGVQIQQENQTLATITLQNYFRLYNKLSGMTGTAQTEAAELHQTYKLGVVPIPTNKPMVRDDATDYIYKTEDAKFAAVIDDIAERHEAGQPVLVGTASVSKSERLASLLLRKGIPHEVLNAKQHAREAAIIANAGRKGAVTIATNMAGRGTDIQLGGNPEFAADVALREKGLTPDETPEEYEAAWTETLENATAETDKEHEEVVELGGLYVLGTERHESRRIDNQLRGRSGRQGDPGESRFYLSLGDDLMVRFNGERVAAMMNMLRLPEDVPIEAKMVSKAIQSAQTQMEQQNFEIRKNVLKYDEVMNKQRSVVYDERLQVLEGADLSDQIRPMIDEVVTGYVNGATASGYPEEWDLDQLWTALKTLYPIGLTQEEAIEQAGGEKSDLTRDYLVEELVADAQAAYDQREEELGTEVARELERRVLMSVLDRKWREHLYEMDYLQEGIGLRAMAQRDPLVEYKREGYDMFAAMMDAVKEESVGFLFNLDVEVDEAGETTAVEPARTPAQQAAIAEADEQADEAAAAEPQLDVSMLKAAQDEHDAAGSAAEAANGASPKVRAKGLDRNQGKQPLTYSAPDLGSDAPAVTTEADDSPKGGTSATAKRQQARSNPNRGSRGNKGGNRNRRKR